MYVPKVTEKCQRCAKVNSLVITSDKFESTGIFGSCVTAYLLFKIGNADVK